jgi:hypothetical protein
MKMKTKTTTMTKAKALAKATRNCDCDDDKDEDPDHAEDKDEDESGDDGRDGLRGENGTWRTAMTTTRAQGSPDFISLLYFTPVALEYTK